MGSLTKYQILALDVLRSGDGLKGFTAEQAARIKRAISGLKRRRLVTPSGKVTPGAIARLDRYVAALEAEDE